jgi:transcriptional/translational regulatory protein YebC/TACO1
VCHDFTKCIVTLGTDNSLAFLFTKRGVITYAPGVDEEALMEAALEVSAEDIVSHDNNVINVFTAWESLGALEVCTDRCQF